MKIRLYVRLLLIACLLLTVASCRSLRLKKDYQRLSGVWKEEWGAADVQYNDIYRITYTGDNRLIITCKERSNYLISDVNYDGKTLRLKLEIRDDKYKSGAATVQYELKLLKSPLLLTGTAVNHENKTIPVKWVKQE